MLSLLREISLRHWLRSPLRSLLVVLGIALGIALYVATESAAASMFTAFGEFVARVSGRAHLAIEGTGLGVPGELLAEVAGERGVAHAAASVELSARAPELGESLLVLGVDFLGDTHFLPFSVEEGGDRVVEDPLVFVNDPSALLLSKRFADRHHLVKDSRIQLLTSEGPKDFFVRGVLEDEGAAASFGGQVAVMFIDAAQLSFARGTFVDRIDVAAAPGIDVSALQSRLQERMPSGVRVELPARLGTRLRSLIGPLHAALWISGFLALLVGGFIVYNAVGVAVAQRRRETGVLRALGVTQRSAALLFCLEAAGLAVPGIALGLALGGWLARYSTASTLDAIDRLYASVPQVVPRLDSTLVLQAAVSGLFMAMLAAYWPARRGAALDPALVIRASSSVEPAPLPHGKLLALGAVLALLAWLPWLHTSKLGGMLAVTLTVLGGALATPALVVFLRAALVPPVEAALGVPGRLGLDYVERALGRSTVNVLALMVAVGMSVSVGGWLSSLERSISEWASQVGVADLTVTQGSPVLDRRHLPLAEQSAERIARLPEVAAVQRFRMIDQQAGDLSFRLVATDTEVFLDQAERRGKGWQVVSGEPLRASELVGSRGILLSENAARRLRVSAGDTLVLATPKGDASFTVRAVIVDYTSESGAGFIDHKHFHELWGDEVVDCLFVYLAASADVDLAAAKVRAALSGDAHGDALFVTKTKALEEHLVQSLHQTFSYSRSVELMALLIALMGVIGTMAAVVLDRRREINVLRAIGATSRQVVTALVVEAGFLGFCAAVAGIAVGIVECHIFLRTLLSAQTGWHLELVFPWVAAARTGALVVATSALAGAFPALRAVRGEIAASITEE